MVEQLAVVPDQLNVAEAILDCLVVGCFQIRAHSTEVHGLLDDHWIVVQSKACSVESTNIINGRSELYRISVLEQLL